MSFPINKRTHTTYFNLVNLYLLLNKYAVNAKVATVLGSIPASSDTVESEGRQMQQCWITYIKKSPLTKKSLKNSTYFYWGNLPKCCSIWFGLRYDGILYSWAVIQRTIALLHFWAQVRRKRSQFEHMLPWPEQAGGWGHFCMKRLRTLNSYQYSRSQIINKKNL